MIIVFGTSGKRKEIKLENTEKCSICSKINNYDVIIDIKYFSIFWIPVFRINTKYFVVSKCCGSVYSINKKLGKEIEKGIIKEVKEEDLYLLDSPYVYNKECKSCNNIVDEGFEYCPHCGNKIF